MWLELSGPACPMAKSMPGAGGRAGGNVSMDRLGGSLGRSGVSGRLDLLQQMTEDSLQALE